MTDDEIELLITCPKRVSAPMKREMKERQGSLHNGFELESLEGGHLFECFVRVLIRFPENFSIGLRYINPDGTDVTIMRCNGDHGLHINRVRDDRTISGYHIHRATPEAMEADRAAEHFAEPTGAYASWEEALHHFLTVTNVQDARAHFPQIYRQMGLLEGLGVYREQLP